MVSFLQVHDAYQEWNDIISHHSPSVSVPEIEGSGCENCHPPASLECEISNKIQSKIYIDKKRHVAHAMIKAMEVARVCFMGVLTFDGGWLEAASYSLDDGSAMMVVEDERVQRLEEMKLLRSKYLPIAVFLLFNILEGTAHWMEEFALETLGTFGQEEGLRILSRISGTDVIEMGKDDMEDDDAASSPFSPEMWYHTALLLANTVANKEYGITSCFNQDELKIFMNCIADSTVSLLRCQERTHKD